MGAPAIAGGVSGMNGAGRVGYIGPCPPPGKLHRYFFRLFALDTMLSLPEGAMRTELESAMAGHMLATTELIGTYERK